MSKDLNTRRAKLLARRDKSVLPFGTSSASVKATRNLVYLGKKGVLHGFVPNARQAAELTADNARKQKRIDDRRFFVAAMQA
jgi:hypothetical protein